MKYRRHKVKREHGIIEKGLNWLEDLEDNPEVTDIIPGVIEISRSPERGIIYKYETTTGCKLLLKSNGSIQEVFVVTKNPQSVRKWVEDHFPLHKQTNLPVNPVKRSESNYQKDPLLIKDNPPLFTAGNLNKQCGYRRKIQSDFIPASQLKSGSDNFYLEDHLEKDVFQALRNLQKDLKSFTPKKKKEKPSK
ncbi:MAG: DUF2103 domain-containing protein [Desulfitobacteriaceae bacterium]|nr:DUF2103 domain-containing protein [Desulfitobacteriaceae bacterium]